MRKLVLAAAVAFSAVAAQASVVTDTFSSYWALGDSLSDNGNLNRLAFSVGTGFAPVSSTEGKAAYYRTGSFFSGYFGRFSNGRTFAEHIAGEFTAAGHVTGNLAHGGAEATEPDSLFDLTPGLEWQRKALARDAGRFGSRPLVSMLMGANDIFDALKSGDPMSAALVAATRAADAIADTARELSALGARDFLIANLPDIGKTPAYALLQPALQPAATAASIAFNERLAENIALLRASGLMVVDLNLYAVMNGMLADPAAYGLTDVTLPCMFDSAAVAGAFGQAQYCSDTDARGRLFFDAVHPNLLAHAQVGNMALAALERSLMPAPVPIAGTLPLLLGGFGVLMIARRRQR